MPGAIMPNTRCRAELQVVSNSLQLHSNSSAGAGPVIDKLDLRVGRSVEFTREFAEVYRHSHDAERSPWMRSRYFEQVADLREYGYEVRLHMFSRLTATPVHKLEIYDVGDKTISEVGSLVHSIFDCNVSSLGLMRVDLCADVYGVPVEWFRRNVVIQRKRLKQEIGTVEPYRTVRCGIAETIYAGRKPNQIRIYNKTAERAVQLRRELGRLPRPNEESFCELFRGRFGHSSEEIVTRVERQVAARDLGRLSLTTFADLSGAFKARPFEALRFHLCNDLPTVEQCGFTTYHAGMHLRRMVEEEGLENTLAHMRGHHGRNFYRERERYAAFLSASGTPALNAEELLSSYRFSTQHQLQLSA